MLVEYMVLNAYEMDLKWIIKMVRAIALAWGPSTKEYDEALTILNLIKQEAAHHSLSAARAWVLVKSIVQNGKHLRHS